MTDRLKKPFEVLWDIVLSLSFLLLFPELTGLCFKLWSKMHQIISLPMVQKQHREGSADAGRWDLHKLWHCGLRFLLCLCEFMRGKSTPSFGLLNAFLDIPKGFRKETNPTSCAKGALHGPEHRNLRTHYWNFQVWPFRALKLRELLLDYPRIFSLASDVECQF